MIEKLFRFHDFMDRCISDLDLSPEMRKEFGAPQQKKDGPRYTDSIIDHVRNGGNFTLLRIRTVEKRPRILMRLIMANEAHDYMEVVPARFPDGEIAIEDIRIFSKGEWLSQIYRRIVLHIAAEQDPEFRGKLKGKEPLYTANISRIIAIGRASQQGRHQEVLDLYHQLPEQIQKDRMIQLMAVVAAQGINDEKYVSVVEKYRLNHPADPACDLISIRYYSLTNRYDEAFKCIDRIDKAVGGDPYLSLIQGSLMIKAGRLNDAKGVLEKAVGQDETLVNAYLWRIEIALKEKKHDEALVWLKRVVEKCKIVMDEQEMNRRNDYFGEFLKTPQCKEFLDWLKTRQR